MKVEEHIRRKEEERKHPTHVRSVSNPMALMVTYNRPGMLYATAASFFRRTDGVPLCVFDDGSDVYGKETELRSVEAMGATVCRLKHGGLEETWHEAFRRVAVCDYDCVIQLEDDAAFAHNWFLTLLKMHTGMQKQSRLPGMMSCFRVHDKPQGAVVDLGGIAAYPTMATTFLVNLIDANVLRENMGVVEEAVGLSKNSKRGMDKCLPEMLAHRLKRVSFMTMNSWVSHMGVDDSVVAKQGYMAFASRGVDPVDDLKEEEMRWEKDRKEFLRV